MPTNGDSVALYLTRAFSVVEKIKSKVNLQKDGAALEKTTVAYNKINDAVTSSVTRKIAYFLPDNIEADNYSVVFDAGLTCRQTIGSSTSNVTTPYAYSQAFTLFDVEFELKKGRLKNEKIISNLLKCFNGFQHNMCGYCRCSGT